MTTNSTTAEMLDSFLAEAWDTVGTLERAVEYLRAPKGFGSTEQLVIVSHRLHGSAGLYRFPEISRLGSLLERVFESAPDFTPAQVDKAVQFAQLGAGCLTEALERIAKTGEEGAVGFDLNRFGGPQLLAELVQLNPSAFARTHSPEGPGHTDAPETAPEDQAAPTPAPQARVSLEEELRAFHAQDPEMWSYFAPEVQEHLESVGQSIESLLMSVVTGENPDDHIKALFRTMHTIKGASYSVGCQPIGKLAHRLEDAMVAVRDGQMAWNQTLASTMIQGADTISLMLAAAEGKQTRLEASLQQTQVLLAQALNEPGLELFPAPSETSPAPVVLPAAPAADTAQNENKPEAKATLRVSLDRLESLMDLTGETVIARGRFDRLVKRYEQLGDDLQLTLKRFERSAQDFTERYLNPRLSNPEVGENAQPAGANTESPAAPTIGRGRDANEVFSELEFDRYDDLNILARTVGEMANDLNELHLQYSSATQGLSRETETLGKLTRNLRSEVSQMRLVPIGRLFSRVRRQARQLSAQKAFKLDVQGEDVEVDNVVLEGLADPLIHLITNAVAHGLELPAERTAKGKPGEGSVSIRAFQRGNFVFVEVQDDGQGINVARVRQQAVQRHLRTQAEVDRLSDEQAMELIFLPGLSTKEVVTEQAGRGVGMDAVWSSVRRLKGEVRIQSEPGYGTMVQLRVPLTLVVSDVLLFGAGGQTFAVPRETVRALRAVPQDAITTFENTPHVLLGAELIPLMDVEPLLGLNATATGNLASIAVLEVGTDKLALRVASFLGLEQAVVRPLEEPLDRLSHLAGATVSSDGEVILVLDPLGLARLGDQNLSTPSLELRRESATVVAPGAQDTKDEAPLHVLLVDDSLSVRRVVAQTLKRNGYTVTTAADGQEALELLSEGKFDVVITDLEMPRLNGFELVEEIRRRRSLEGLPVAMLTSRASDKHAHLAMELGVNEYLTKPLDESKLQRFLGSIRGKEKAMVTT